MFKHFVFIITPKHWLYPDDHSYLLMLSNDFNRYGLSPMFVKAKLPSCMHCDGVG